MAVSIDHRTESGCLRLEIKLIEVVQHINGNATDLNDLRLRQLLRPRSFVDVSANRGHGRNQRELLKDLRITHISRMDNPLRPAQGLDGFRANQPVCIGNNADVQKQYPVASTQFSVSNTGLPRVWGPAYDSLREGFLAAFARSGATNA